MVALNVLVTGARGQLGQALSALELDSSIQFSFYSKEQLDITDLDQVRLVVQKQTPDIVVNCAAYTAVDRAEREPERAYLVNEQGVKHLVEVCREQRCKLLQISTDYVFAGNTIEAYTEHDSTSPINIYGSSKQAGELAALTLADNALIIRTSWLISAYSHNFFNSILLALKNNKPLTVVNDQYGTPTNASVLAVWIVQILPLFNEGKVQGIYHAAASTACSWYQMAVEIQRLALEKNIISDKIEITPITTENYTCKHKGLLAPRPSNSSLRSDKLMQALEGAYIGWQAMVNECFNTNN